MSFLSRIAILGTAQTTGNAESGTDADALVGKLKLDVDGGEAARERALLLRAGAAAVLRRAGTRATPWSAPIVPAGDETWTRAGAVLAALITSLLDGDDDELLAEALEGMARAELRLPEELLPKALDERDPALRERLLPVLGVRGRWLAEQELDPGWSWARPIAPGETERRVLSADADRDWVEGSTVERELLLTFARKLEPDRGRAWVESSFKADKPEQRRRWIELLEIGLSTADVPFLESALGDRSAVVKVRAARALWRLPETRVASAVRERLDALISPNLGIELPAEPFDGALERLGIVEAPPQGAGKRQWWLAQLLSAVPPSYFERRSQRTPAALVDFAAKHDLREVLLDGWTSAALRFDAAGWLAPLWDAWSEEESPKSWTTPRPLTAITQRLLATNRQAELEPRLVHSTREARHLDLLTILPRPWPETIAEACLSHVRARSRAFIWSLPMIAARIPLALASSAIDLGERREGKRDHYDDGLEKFKTLLDLRQKLASEIEAHRAARPLRTEATSKGQLT